MGNSDARRLIGVVQARVASTRLPSKVLADFGGVPLVVHISRRLAAIPAIAEVVVATTTASSDDPLEDVCARFGIRCVRGPTDDLVSRLLVAARAAEASALARVWGDCPFVSPEAVQAGWRRVREQGAGVVATTSVAGRTYPVGGDVEIWPVPVLEAILAGTDNPALREFPIEFVRRNPERFRIAALHWERDLHWMHLCVDYPEDLDAARAILDALHGRGGANAGLADIVTVLDRDPALLGKFANAPRNVEYHAYVAAASAQNGGFR